MKPEMKGGFEMSDFKMPVKKGGSKNLVVGGGPSTTLKVDGPSVEGTYSVKILSNDAADSDAAVPDADAAVPDAAAADAATVAPVTPPGVVEEEREGEGGGKRRKRKTAAKKSKKSKKGTRKARKGRK